ncbi:MAG: hypothetical protein CMH83_13735 [Nocardioides sp.]|nr:hypothetical protein [Nocardioides sp.]
MPPLELTVDDARRVAVRAAGLDAGLDTAGTAGADLLDVAHHLTGLPTDRTRAVARAADLVLWSRLGDAHRPPALDDAVERLHLVLLAGALRPVADAVLFRAQQEAWPNEGAPMKDWHRTLVAWVEANDAARRDVLDELRREGALPMTALPDTCTEPWRSSGWNDGKNLRMLVAQLVARGEVAVLGSWEGFGGETHYDLAERVYPDEPAPPLAEALAEQDRRRLASYGVARAGWVGQQGEPVGAGEAGEPATVAGLRGRWRVDPAALAVLDEPAAAPGDDGTRVVLLAPFDPLVHHRKRMTDLLGFDYTLEMYKPAAQRRWGYYALPVLAAHDLVGKVDATADHESGELLLHAVHLDEPWAADVPSLEGRVREEVDALAARLGLDAVDHPHPAA